MHRTLKYCVFEKKSIRRMDRAIFLITVLFDEIYSKFDRMLIKPTSTKKSSRIFKLHEGSVAESKNFLIEKSFDEKGSDVFVVKHISSNKSYTFTPGFLDKHRCHLNCKMCWFCIPTFKCSCHLNRHKGEFCSHLHLLSTMKHLLPQFDLPDNPFFKFCEKRMQILIRV